MKPNGLYLIWSKIDDCQLDHYRTLLQDHIVPGVTILRENDVSPHCDLPDLIFCEDDRSETEDGVALYGWWMLDAKPTLHYLGNVDPRDCDNDVHDLLVWRNFDNAEACVQVDVPLEYLWENAVACHNLGLFMNITLVNGPGGGNPLVEIGGDLDNVKRFLTEVYMPDEPEEALTYLDS